jgi:hypothetical protein
MFEKEFADAAEPAPRELTCPKCEYPRAVKAFVVRAADAGCAPGGSC